MLEGGPGNDTLYGGTGADDLKGGTGADTFAFLQESVVDTSDEEETRTLSNERDWVRDFKQSEGDRLDLRDLKNHSLFTGGTTPEGTTPDTNLILLKKGEAFTSVKGQVKWWQHGEQTSTEDDDVTHVQVDLDGNGTADFQVTLAGLHTLTDTDFILA